MRIEESALLDRVDLFKSGERATAALLAIIRAPNEPKAKLTATSRTQ